MSGLLGSVPAFAIDKLCELEKASSPDLCLGFPICDGDNVIQLSHRGYLLVV